MSSSLSWSRRLGFVVALCTALSGILPSDAVAQLDDKIKVWAMNVLLGVEYGSNEKIAVRWIRNPTLSIFGGGPEHQATVAQVVGQINDALATAPVGRISITAPDNSAADIQVHITPLASFASLSESLEIDFYPENFGYFYIRWNEHYELTSAFVLLASDRLHGPDLLHFALEEITQSLGLACDSPLLSDSIFYQQGSDGGSAQRLSPADRKLLLFLYRFVPPGSDSAKLESLLLGHWNDL